MSAAINPGTSVDATPEARAARLAECDIFRGVSAEAIGELARLCRARVLASGERLPREQDGFRYIVFVWNGEMLVVRDEPTRIIFLNVPPGSLFRVAYAVADAHEYYEIESNAPNTSVLLIPGARVRELARTYPDVAMRLVRLMSERVNLGTDALCRLRVRDPEERVLAAIRTIDRERGLELGGTVTMLAEHVGLRRETVSRALVSLEKRGLIRRSPVQVVWVADPGAETSQAEPKQTDPKPVE